LVAVGGTTVQGRYNVLSTLLKRVVVSGGLNAFVGDVLFKIVQNHWLALDAEFAGQGSMVTLFGQ
jgi:hypothetical protein